MDALLTARFQRLAWYLPQDSSYRILVQIDEQDCPQFTPAQQKVLPQQMADPRNGGFFVSEHNGYTFNLN